MHTKSILIGTLLLLMSAPLYAQNPGDNVFAGIQVHTVNLKFDQANYWDTLTYLYSLGTELLIPATATINGTVVGTVGVRLKGNSSYTHPNDKKSFKINFDEYTSSLRWDQMKAIHLNNCWGDPSMMREKIHLDFLKDAGVIAPRANFARLTLNDSLWGLYSLVEHVDKTFLTTRFANKAGDLFKAVDAFDTSGSSIVSDFCSYGTADSLYYKHYELKTDGSTTAWPQLRVMIDSLNNGSDPATAMASKINLSSVYKMYASDVLFTNLDSYINSGRNFYVYFLPTTGKMEWIIWDVGLSFGAYGTGVSKLETMSVGYVVNATDRPMIGKILAAPSLKTAYLSTLNTMFLNYFTATRLFPHIDSVANVIRSYVTEDVRKMFTTQQFETNISADVNSTGGAATRKPGLKSFLSARITSVQSQLTALGVTSAPSEEGTSVPSSIVLAQNYPNPFNPVTQIQFSVSRSTHVRLAVYDVLGREVARLVDGLVNAGTHSIAFNAHHLVSGMYLYRIVSGSSIETKQMMLMK